MITVNRHCEERSNLSFFIKVQICFYFLFTSLSIAQTQKVTLIKTIDTKGKFFTTDKLGNVYIIEKSEIKKYNENGDLQQTYNYKDLGAINYLDATDPFKVMLFQPEFLKIRTLDSRLNLIGELDLNYQHDLGLPRLACVTDDGNLWIYDQQNQRLVKIDQKGNKLLAGNSLSQTLNQSTLNPKSLVATDTWLLMRNVDSTIYVFDKFGNYFRSVQVNCDENFQARGNLVLYLNAQIIYSRDVTNGFEKKLELPELKGAQVVRMEQNRLYLKKEDKLEIYSF